MARHGGGFAIWYLQSNPCAMNAAGLLLTWIIKTTMQATTYAAILLASAIPAIQRKLQGIGESEKITSANEPRTDSLPSRTRAQFHNSTL